MEFKVGDIITPKKDRLEHCSLNLGERAKILSIDILHLQVKVLGSNRHTIVFARNYKLVKLKKEKPMNIQKIEEKMSKRQRWHYNRLKQGMKLCYISSFLGTKDKYMIGRSPNNVIKHDRRVFDDLHSNDGRILQMHKSRLRDLCNPNLPKKPIGMFKDWVGIEIECFLPKASFEGDVQCECECTCNSECETCGHSIDEDCDGECRENCECSADYTYSVSQALKAKHIKNIQVVTDGSLSHDDSDYFGIEIKVLCRIEDMSNLKQVCEFLKENKAVVNATCGLHVHLNCKGMEDKEIKRINTNFIESLKHLVKMLPKSRQNNSYCRYGYSSSERYYMLNGTALEKHGTLEVRMHSGSVDYTKIVNWCLLLNNIKNYNREIYALGSDDLHDWLNVLALPFDLKAWTLSRIAKFSGSELPQDETFEESEAA